MPRSFLIRSGTLDARGTALEIKEFLLLSTVGSDTWSIPPVNVWMLVRTTAWTLGRDVGSGGGSRTNCMWDWFTGWGKTSPVSRRLLFTASAMASVIHCRTPSGTLACCWLAVPPAEEVEAISAGISGHLAKRCWMLCVLSRLSSFARTFRNPCEIRIVYCWPLSFWQHPGRGRV